MPKQEQRKNILQHPQHWRKSGRKTTQIVLRVDGAFVPSESLQRPLFVQENKKAKKLCLLCRPADFLADVSGGCDGELVRLCVYV